MESGQWLTAASAVAGMAVIGVGIRKARQARYRPAAPGLAAPVAGVWDPPETDAMSGSDALELLRQAVALNRLGRPTEALPAAEQAVRLCRERADADPETYEPRWQQAQELLTRTRAAALFNEAVTRHGEPDRLDVAELIYAEVVRRFGGDPDPVLRDLTAKARFNRGFVLSRLRRDGESARVFGELADQVHGDPAYREMTAKARYSQAISWQRLDRTADARAAAGKAVALYRELAGADPARYQRSLDRAEEILSALAPRPGLKAGLPAGAWPAGAWPAGAVRAGPGPQRRTIILPVLAPRSRSMKALGAFSSPSTTVSLCESLPSLSQPPTSATMSAIRLKWSVTMKPRRVSRLVMARLMLVGPGIGSVAL
jgi:tetratricopeptide (TPR) repeat protein